MRLLLSAKNLRERARPLTTGSSKLAAAVWPAAGSIRRLHTPRAVAHPATQSIGGEGGAGGTG